MSKEVWKDVPNYEGHYQVSNMGNVRSIDRYVNQLNYRRLIKGKLLSQCLSMGYPRVGLTKNGKHDKIRVHALVAMAFLGHKQEGYKLVVNHIDNNKQNNNVENLEVVTQRYNASCHKKGYSSKYVGVAWINGNQKWRASIRVDGVLKHIGLYEVEEDARDAYIEYLKTIQ